MVQWGRRIVLDRARNEIGQLSRWSGSGRAVRLTGAETTGRPSAAEQTASGNTLDGIAVQGASGLGDSYDAAQIFGSGGAQVGGAAVGLGEVVGAGD